MRLITLADLRHYVHECLGRKDNSCDGTFRYTKLFCARHRLDMDAVLRMLKALDIECDCEIALPSFCDKYDNYSANMSAKICDIGSQFNLILAPDIVSVSYKYTDNYDKWMSTLPNMAESGALENDSTVNSGRTTYVAESGMYKSDDITAMDLMRMAESSGAFDFWKEAEKIFISLSI